MSQFTPTPEQAQALTAPAPLLVLAGAGTGKTTVLTRRIAGLIASGEARPDQVLALTFTDKAAAEMAERLAEILGEAGLADAARTVTARTFHSFGGQIVHENLLRLGRDRAPTVLSGAAAWQLLASIFDDLDFQAIEVTTGQVAITFGRLLDFFSRCQDHLVTPADLERHLARLDPATLSSAVAEQLAERRAQWADAAAAYRCYEAAKHAKGWLDFGDQLLLPVKLLQADPALREAYRRRYPFIFVDEYQDTNHAQRLLLLQLLDPAQPRIMVIGDDDQAIYRWRGAVVHNILRFAQEKVFAEGQVAQVPMTLNRRSYPPILELANLAIQQVSERHPKALTYHEDNRAGRALIGHYLAASDLAEARWLAGQIRALEPEARALPGKKRGYGAFAILCRKRRLFTTVGRALEEANIPYELIGGTGFYGRWEIRDVLSYLRVLASSADDVALARILRSPRWRLAGRDLYHLGAWVTDQNGGRGREATQKPEAARLHFLDAVLRHQEVSGLAAAAHERLSRLGEELQTYAAARLCLSLPDLVARVIDGTGYRQELESRGGFDARVALLNLAKLEQLARDFAAGEGEASLAGFVDYVTYAVESGAEEDEVRPVDEETNTVKVMTIHQAKGLEFPIVFIPGLAERIFPDRPRDEADAWWQVPWELRGDREYLPSLDYAALRSKKELEARKQAEKELQLDEERRLFYVAITRAQRQLYFSRAHWYGMNKKPRQGSPFWDLVLASDLSRNLGEEGCPDENPNRSLAAATAEAPGERAADLPDGLPQLLLAGADPSPRLAEVAQKEGADRWAVLKVGVDDHLERLRSAAGADGPPQRVALTCSSLVVYLLCPRHYRYVYVDNLPVRPSPSLALGREVHRLLEELARGGPLTLAWPPSDEAEEAAPREGEEGEFDVLLGGEADRGGDVAAMLARYRAGEYGRRPPTYVELPFTLSLAAGTLRGRIDRLDRLADGTWEVIDFKSGLPLPTLAPGYGHQMSLYALAVRELWRVPAARLRAHVFFLRDGSDLPLAFTEAELESVRLTAEQALRAIARGEYPPAASPHLCAKCDYAHLCT